MSDFWDGEVLERENERIYFFYEILSGELLGVLNTIDRINFGILEFLDG